ncbi:putative MFS efflux transporter [Talaromyces proteolyticus]|uniref:MFS efflux transporter n=1 Tax=Talaromyces proteolyticus TaxID=1131652 RepID=A0AAD4L371_9EURO|nr:putative MFS efflux transporter [Talaromyces proteolyticus]KAH8705097.1 putative MFS efflux transporter [Talaromyces proteolyticus]
MAAQLAALFDVESSHPTQPPAAVRKHNTHVASSPIDHELEDLHLNTSHLTSNDQALSRVSRSSIQAPSDLESLPPTPGTPNSERNHHESESTAAEMVQSISNPPRNKWRFASACLMFLSNGMSDSAPGALIPYMETNYHIGYAIVSLIFVANAAGFILAAPLTHLMEGRYGRSRTAIFCQALLVAGFLITACKSPFPAVVTSFFLIGLGVAINLALNNVFLANLVNGTEILGIGHGSYGVGGTIAPLIGTAMASHGIHWSYFYFITLSLATFNLFFAGWAFKGFGKEMSIMPTATLQRTTSAPAVKKNILAKALKSRVTLLGAIFIFTYQGAEVAISGWIVSYLINYRDGDPSHVGYVSAGFWAGITIGRFVLSYPARRLGEKVAVLVLVAGAIAFQIMTWLIPNIIGQAVTVSVLGLLLGPVYPCATVVFNRLLPREIQTASLSFISAMGSSGGAVAPFVTGLLSQSLGTVVLHPICLVLYGVMVASWCCLPKMAKRSE